MKTRSDINIYGKRRQYCGLSNDGREIILTRSKIVMFPTVRYGGGTLDPLPSFAPAEIRLFRAQLPDLTSQFPRTVLAAFNTRRKYFADVTYANYHQSFPQVLELHTEAEFEQGRQLILSESLEDYTKSHRAHAEVWQKHGTPEHAAAVGYENSYLAGLLEHWLATTIHSTAIAKSQVQRLKAVAIYANPQRTRIYLSDFVESPYKSPASEISAEVIELLQALGAKGNQAHIERAWSGGRSTFRLKDHPEAYRFIRSKGRFLIKANNGNKSKAIRKLRPLLKEKYPDAPKIGDSTIRNILDGITGLVMKRNSKRL